MGGGEGGQHVANMALQRLGYLSFLRIALGLLFFQHGAEKLWGFAVVGLLLNGGLLSFPVLCCLLAMR